VDYPDAAAVVSCSPSRRDVNCWRVRIGGCVYAGDAHDRCVIIMCIRVHSQQILLYLICLFSRSDGKTELRDLPAPMYNNEMGKIGNK